MTAGKIPPARLNRILFLFLSAKLYGKTEQNHRRSKMAKEKQK